MVLKADISLDTLLTALRQAGCGEPHPVFAGGLRYVPPSAARQTSRAAFEELSEHCFTQGDGFTPEFDDVLHLLDRPATEFFAYARDLTEQIGVLVAARGRTAVTAVCQGTRVWLKGVPPDTHPVDALVANLPPYRAAEFKPFTLPQQDFRDAPVSDVFDDAPARSREAQRLDDLLKQPHVGIGQLYAAKQVDGQRTEARDSLSYLDVDAGRVGIGLAGEYITVMPGDPVVLGRKVAALLDS
ncbi:ESX secretion-associated protein EspG [Amycolatopsis sp. NPDC049252]|uniref:ESX secretion-associated protein EspG n=1 Tax=Amycolatopsis sp. NPDC049252 TaxID=3363933 RepID=UPI00371CB20D